MPRAKKSPPENSATHTVRPRKASKVLVTLKALPEEVALLDRAAAKEHRNRTSFMLAHSLKAAELAVK